MIKVLQVGMGSTLGGIESYLINYDRNIDKKKIKFDYVNMGGNKLCFEDEIKKNGGIVYSLPNYQKRPIKYMKQMIKILKDNHYDVLHYNMNSAVFLYPLIAAKLAKTTVIIAHSHNSSNDKGILKSILHGINKHFIPLFANTYFACSKRAGEWFFSRKNINSNKFFVINNAIDIEKFRFNENIRNQKRKELKIKENEIVIGHIGRFFKQKNHKFLIEAFNLAVKENNNLKLLLIGTGSKEENIKQLVHELKLDNKVLFLGQRSDVCELYQAIDIFALPSLYEGLPLVGVEAQSAGCLSLFSNTITKELNLTNVCKYLPIDDITIWKDTILSYEINVENRKKIEIPEYNIKVNAKNLEKIYIERVN